SAPTVTSWLPETANPPMLPDQPPPTAPLPRLKLSRLPVVGNDPGTMVGVFVGVLLGVGVGELVGVLLGVGVLDGVGVLLGVNVAVGVFVGVLVGTGRPVDVPPPKSSKILLGPLTIHMPM